MVMLGMVSLMMQCRKDETTTKVIDSTLVMDQEQVSFLITVVDEDDQLLDGTTLSIADDAQLYTPNENNIYIIDNITVPDIGRKISVEKEGYYPQIKMLTGRSQSKNLMEVVMIKMTDGVEINTGETGSIDGNGTLRLPATLVNSNGAVYTGPVKVQSHYYDPDDANYIQQAPGNMLGLNDKDEYVILGSLGMYLIELSNPDSGEQLNIPEGSTARISFPVADSQSGDIPASIPLWSMDEDLGIWIYEGEASLVDDQMIADVSHFSWWNCDLPYEFIPFCATFVTSNGETVPGLQVNAYVNDQGFGNDITDDEGKICAKLPKNEMVDLTLFYNNEDMGEVQIGPFAEAPIDITIEVPSSSVVSGVAVDCNQMLVTNGYGIATSTSGVTPVFINSDGSFLYPLAEENHSLLLVNQSNNEFESVNIPSSTTDINLGNVEICNQVDAGRFYGKVMLDVEEDGVSDIPLEGIDIKVRNVATGQIDFIVTSDVEGRYSVMGIPGVEYELFIGETSDYRVMYQGDLTPEDNFDNELWSNITRDEIGISAVLQDVNEVDEDNDFQLAEKGIGTLKVKVMRDLDGDGIGDVVMPNYEVMIDVFTSSNSQITSLFTSINGEITFTTGNFIGELSVGQGSVSDFDSSPDPDGDDSNLGPNGVIPIRLTAGEVDEDNEFVVSYGEISGSVLLDTDDDGIGDTPIPASGADLISLLDSNFNSVNSMELTDEMFNFSNIPSGDYYLDLQYFEVFGYQDVNSQDISNDDDLDESDELTGLNDFIIPVRLETSEIDADNNFVFKLPIKSISGNVSEDVDNDGIGDAPIEGVEISLLDLSGIILSTILTDNNGDYQFNDLIPGDYMIRQQDEAELDSDFVDVYDGDDTPEDADDAVDGSRDDIINVTLEENEHDADNNFVEIQHGSISGNLSIDTDNDDVGDTPNEGQTVTLTDVDSGEIFTAVSDENGDYEFQNLAPGDFTLSYTVPAGYIAVFDGDESPEDADDSVDFLDDGDITVTLLPGEDDEDNNFVDRPE